MPARVDSRVEVAVVDVARKPLAGATVTLTAVTGKAADFSFDAARRRYVAVGVAPGHYQLSVQAANLAPELRTLDVRGGRVTELFILGPAAAPFLMRGRVRVPLDPPPGLWAVSVPSSQPGVADPAFGSLAKKLGFQQIASPVPGVIVLREPAGVDTKGIQSRAQKLRSVRNVDSAGPVVSLDAESISYLTGEIVLKLDKAAGAADRDQLVKRFGLQVIRSIPYVHNALLVRTTKPRFGVLDDCRGLAATRLVEYAEAQIASTARNAAVIPTDALYPSQWHLATIQAAGAWSALRSANPSGTILGTAGDGTFGDPSVVIAVLDQGIKSDSASPPVAAHPEFQDQVTTGDSKVAAFYDFSSTPIAPNNLNATDTHGIECSGVAAGGADNTGQIVGVAPNCRVMALMRPGASGGAHAEQYYADAYVWAAGFDPQSTRAGFPARLARGADVITNSFTFLADQPLSSFMSDVFDFLTTYGRNGRGVVLCFATGDGANKVGIDFAVPSVYAAPWATHEKTFAVASSNQQDTHSVFSNYGARTDVCAPGGDWDFANNRAVSGIVTTIGTTRPDYGTFVGTSASTPVAAGVAALVLSANPALSWTEVRQVLRETAIKVDPLQTNPAGAWAGTGADAHSEWYGYGRVAADAAVQLAQQWKNPVRDIVVRDSLDDTGVVPSPGSVFWESPDVWVRQLNPTTDGAAALPATYDDAPPHENAMSGADNYVYVRLKNTGSSPSYAFDVRVYVSHFAGAEFVYPDDFVPVPPSPGALIPGTYLIGVITGVTLDAGEVNTWNVPWPAALVPPSTADVNNVTVTWHPCLLVEVSPHDGPPAAGAHVWESNNLAQRNVTIVYTASRLGFSTATTVGNSAADSRLIELVVDRESLPEGFDVHVDVADATARRGLVNWLRAHRAAAAKRTAPPPLPVGAIQNDPSHAAHARVAQWAALQTRMENRRPVVIANDRQTRIPLFAPGARSIPIVIGCRIPEGTPAGRTVLRLVQHDEQGRIAGGVSFEIVVDPAMHPKHAKRAKKRRAVSRRGGRGAR